MVRTSAQREVRVPDVSGVVALTEFEDIDQKSSASGGCVSVVVYNLWGRSGAGEGHDGISELNVLLKVIFHDSILVWFDLNLAVVGLKI